MSSEACILKDNSTIHIAAGDERSFATPGNPSVSGTGSCSWNITVPPGKFIKLNFLSFSEYCNDNYAEVFEVTKSTSKHLTRKFCKEKVVYSEGNNVLVKYTRLSSHRYVRGFFASYVAAPAIYSCSKRYPYVYNLTGTYSGEFASFNYPVLYSNDARCSWVLEILVGYRIQVIFDSFAVQNSEGCSKDYVEIKQGFKEEWASTVKKLCDLRLPDPVLLNANMYVDFVSDSSGNFPGFHARYKVTPNRKYWNFKEDRMKS